MSKQLKILIIRSFIPLFSKEIESELSHREKVDFCAEWGFYRLTIRILSRLENVHFDIEYRMLY
jgi:hypothetical protein